MGNKKNRKKWNRIERNGNEGSKLEKGEKEVNRVERNGNEYSKLEKGEKEVKTAEEILKEYNESLRSVIESDLPTVWVDHGGGRQITEREVYSQNTNGELSELLESRIEERNRLERKLREARVSIEKIQEEFRMRRMERNVQRQLMEIGKRKSQ